jgi:threonine synthase
MNAGPQLRCIACDATFPAVEHYACPDCGGELDVTYDLARIRAEGSFARAWARPGPIAHRFAPLLPLAHPERAITLGEGQTPLIRSHRLAARLGLHHLYFKLEGSNPTGSFKDRQMAIGLSKAREWGATRFATVSSGNVGVALSAYAARAGAEALVWVSHETPAAKLQQIQVYGARLFLLPSPVDHGADAYFGAVTGLSAFCRPRGLTPMISARPVNPYMVEGGKTLAFETACELGRAPDLVILPAGGGGLVGGVHKGFGELAALGLAGPPPRLLAAQRRAYFVPIDDLGAPGYETGFYRPMDGRWAWDSIRASGGTLRHMDDAAIHAAQSVLACEEGIFAEPHGAYAAAALLEAAHEGALDPDALTVCVISGHGLKDAEAAAGMVRRLSTPPPLDVPTLAETPLGPSTAISTTDQTKGFSP